MSLAWFKECRAALDTLAAEPLRQRYGIEDATHRRELLDKLAETNSALLLGIGDTLQLGCPTMATTAVIGALADLRADIPWLFVGTPYKKELADLIIALDFGGVVLSHQHEYVHSSTARATVDDNRRRLWDILRKLHEAGKPWPDLGDDWAHPRLVIPKAIQVTRTPPRRDRAPPAVRAPARHGFRRMCR